MQYDILLNDVPCVYKRFSDTTLSPGDLIVVFVKILYGAEIASDSLSEHIHNCKATYTVSSAWPWASEDRPSLKTPITSLLCALEIVFNSVYVCLSMCWRMHGTAGTFRVLQGPQSPLELVVSYCESPGAGTGNQTHVLWSKHPQPLRHTSSSFLSL